MTLDELYANPKFQAASYETQQALKRDFFSQNILTLPKVASAPVEVQQQLYQDVMSKAPAFEGLGGISLTDAERQALDAGQTPVSDPLWDYKRAVRLRERSDQGDLEAANKITGWVVSRRIANETLVGQLALASKDTLDQFFNEGVESPEIARDKSNLSKMSNYLLSGIRRDQAETAAGLATAASISAGIAETMALNVVLVGSGALPGLLTKGLFSTLKTAGAAATSEAGKVALKSLAPQVISALGGGAIDVMRSLPELVNSSRIIGDKGTWTKVAQTFGEGVAWDLLFSGATSLLHHVAVPYVKALKNMDVTDEKTIRSVLDSADGVNPENFERLLNDMLDGPEAKELVNRLSDVPAYIRDKQRFRAIRNVGDVDLRSPEGFTLLAKAALHDADIAKNGLITLSRNGEQVFQGTSMSEAMSYMTSWLKSTDALGVMDDTLSAASRASSPTVRLRRTTTGTLDPNTLSPKFLARTIQPNANGAVEPRNVAGVARTVLRQNNLSAEGIDVKVIPRSQFFDPQSPVLQRGGKTIYVPDNLSSVNDNKAFFSYLSSTVEDIGRSQALAKGIDPSVVSNSITDTMNTLLKAVEAPTNLSPLALKASVEKIGGKVQDLGSSIQITLPGNAPQTYTDLREASKAVSKFVLDNDLLTDEEYFEAVGKATGIHVGKEVQPETGIPLYVARSRDGSIIQRASTKAELAALNENLEPKLPDVLAPKLVFVDDSQTVEVSGTFAIGSQTQMRKLLDNYTSYSKMFGPRTEQLVDIRPDGSTISLKGKNTLTVEVPSLGFSQRFSTLDRAKKFLTADRKKYETIEQVANEKGYRIDPTPGGDLLVRSSDGKTFIAKTREQLEGVLRDAPDPSFQQDIVTAFSPEIDGEIAARAADKLAIDPSVMKYDFVNEQWRTPLHEWGTYSNAFWRPMMSTIERVARITGDSSITNTMRQFVVRKRLMGASARRAEGLINQVMQIDGKKLSRSDANQLMKLLELPEDKWAQAASTMGMKFTSSHDTLLRRTRQLYDFYGKKFGVDMDAMLSSYAPKIRKFLIEMDTDPELRKQFATASKEKILQSVFAGQPDALKTVEFFAKHTRLDTFLTVADNKNIVTATRFYVEHGLRELYLADFIESTNTWFKKLAGNPAVNEVDLSMVESYLNAITGKTSSPSQVVVGNRSMAASVALAHGIRKLKVLPGKHFADAIDDIADNMITLDLPSKLQSAVTYSTLGWRPVRALTNMMQYNNTMAVFGHYADDAVGELSRDTADEYIKQMFRKGLLTEKIFASGAETPQAVKGILERSLRSQQNVEYLTRAWTARAAEKAFDENFPLFASGKIDFKKFVKLSNMDILDPTAIQTIAGFIKQGNPESARDLFQSEAIRMLMFDYSKENYPLAFKGVLGRMFGKFGVYPVGQIDLYNSILTRGDAASRTVRALRMLGLTTATYEAFRMAGIDYSGFLAFDPLQFSGGPLYQTLQDALSARESGPEGALARTRLMRSWKLAVPFSLQAGKVIDAVNSLNDGNVHQALVEAMSARYTPDSLLTGATW